MSSIVRTTLFAILCTLAACGRDAASNSASTQPATPAAAAPRAKPLNLLIVVLDTLRPDHLSCYGAPRVTSPHLDRLARESIVFDDAQSAAPLTVASLLSLMTSLYPDVHQVQGKPNPGRMSASVTTLAEILKRAGYATAAFTEGGYAKGDFGLDQGFDLYPRNPGDDESNFSNLQYPSRIGANLDRTLEWLKRERRDPFFLFFHTYEIHSPYRTREEYVRMFRPDFDEQRDHQRVARAIETWNQTRHVSREDCLAIVEHYYQCSLEGLPQLRDPDAFDTTAGALGFTPGGAGWETVLTLARDLYDASIRYADHELERLWNALDELALEQDTLIVVVSDHGEGLGQHGQLEHGDVLNQEILRVLLMIHVPGREFAARRVSELVRTVDVVPTVLELLHVDAGQSFFQGASLVPLLRGARSERVAFSHARREAPGLAPQHSVFDGRWRLIAEPSSASAWLFDHERDRGELADVAAGNPQVVARLTQLLERQAQQDRRLRELLATRPQALELDQATLRELRALGYAGADEDRGHR